MLRSRKALSPVIASIILIAVTVAVSIAVAAWMGALSFSFMNNGEQVQLGSPYGWVNSGSQVYVRVSCPGGNAITISAIRINSLNCPNFTGSNGVTIAPNTNTILTITYGNGVTNSTFLSSRQYTFVITTAKNNEFQTTGMCP